jgi:hypothetical protein
LASTWFTKGSCRFNASTELQEGSVSSPSSLVEFRDRKQTVLGMLIAPVPGLAQNELTVVGIVPDVQPVERLLEGWRPADGQPGRPRIHTGDQDVYNPIRLLCEVPGGGVPFQSPEEVQPVGNYQ